MFGSIKCRLMTTARTETWSEYQTILASNILVLDVASSRIPSVQCWRSWVWNNHWCSDQWRRQRSKGARQLPRGGGGGANGGNSPPQLSPGSILRSAQIRLEIIITGVWGVATSTIDLDSDWYFDLCKKNQNHCNKNVFWSQNMAKMLWRPGLCPGPSWRSLQCSPRPQLDFAKERWGKERRRRNVRKEGEGMRDKKEENRGKGGGGTLLISFVPQPLNPGDATV